MPNQRYRRPRIVVEQRELTGLPRDHIRVEMLYAGVCGTDLHLIRTNTATGYLETSSPATIPPRGRIFGHEGIGRIIELGAAVSHLQIGAVVALESIVVCHQCDRCRRGLFNQCRNSRLLGMEEDGLFTSISEVPASLAHDVSHLARTDAGSRALAVLEPAGVAFVACQNGSVRPGDRVVIFGAGPIGLYAAMLARRTFGASTVHIVEPAAFRRNFAASRADHVYTPEQFFAAAPDDIDVAIEASGAMSNIDGVLPLMNADSRIVMLARSGEPLVLTHTDHMITNAVSIAGSRGHLCGAFETLIGLYERERFSPGEIVTDVVEGLDALSALLATPERIISESCKVLVKL